MNAQQFREHLRKQPFEPFRLHMSDGSSFEVRHPEHALVTQREITVAIPSRTNEVPERAVYCDPLHITRIEPIVEARTRQRRNGS